MKTNEQELKIKLLLCNKDDKNCFCVDCGIKSMDYASINNGVIICSKCAEEHKKLGYQISFLHKLSEKWDDYLFNYMKAGGNSRFTQFCKDYKLENRNLDINNKYRSKGCCYYREIIHSEVMGYDPPDNINVNTAFEIQDTIEDNYPEFKNYYYVKHVNANNIKKEFYTKKKEKEEEEGGFFNSLGNMFGYVKQKVNEGTDELMNKVSEMNIKEKMFGGGINYIDYFFGENEEKENKSKEEDKKNEDKSESSGLLFFNIFGVNEKEYKNNDDKNYIKDDEKKNENSLKNENDNIINNNIEENKMNINENNKKVEENKIEENENNNLKQNDIKNNKEEVVETDLNKKNGNTREKLEKVDDKKEDINEEKIDDENDMSSKPKKKEENKEEFKQNNVDKIINEVNCDNNINDEEKNELEKILNE